MSEVLFPRTEVGGVSLSRMIIGTNWMAGYSHTGDAANKMILDRNGDPKNLEPILETYLKYGIDTIMAPFGVLPHIMRAIQTVQEKTGKGFILVDTPTMNVDNNTLARQEAQAIIEKSKKLGATFCFLHQNSVEQLVNKNTMTIDRLDDYTKMIRDAGLIPGLGAHMPEVIVYSDLNNYDVETYVQLYNCMGFLMQVEIETVHSVIWNAKKPVMSIKSMAAGRCTPFVGLNFSWATLRDCDMVTIGAFTEWEAEEDIQISLEALSRRYPELKKGITPKKPHSFGGKLML